MYPDTPQCLREVITAGEQLRITPAIATFFQAMPNCKLINQYGPTETHVVTSFELKGAPVKWPTLPPIGYPIDNSRIYILDPNLEPMPIGVTGDLYIGSRCVARGYLHDDDLTAERFIANPFTNGGDTLYHSGDRARFLADGCIEFMGREDDQVKIRGFRIEPGEIEATLAEHAAVRQAVVTARDRTDGDKYLVAYLVPGQASLPSESVLCEHLHQTLPEYMIPSRFVVLDALPLTSSGKVDRKSLPAPEPSREVSERVHVAARTVTEQALAEIWADVLGLDRVGVEDNFFELGGNSLLAVRLINRIETVLARRMSTAALFTAPTIERFATLVDIDSIPETNNAIVPLQPHGSRNPLFLLPGYDGDLLCFRGLVRHLERDRPICGLQWPDISDQSEPLAHIEDMASYFVQQILTHQYKGPYNLGGYSSGGAIAYEMARQLTDSGYAVDLLVLFDTYSPTALIEKRPLSQRLIRYVQHMLHLDAIGKVQFMGDRLINATRCLRRQRTVEPATTLPPLPMMHRVMEITRQAYDRYRPQPYCGRGILFRATDSMFIGNWDNGWSELLQGGLDVHPIRAGHANLFANPDLAHKLQIILK